MTLELLIVCPLLGWTLSIGPVHHYDIFVDEVYDHSTIAENPMSSSACFADREPHTVTVQAVSADGTRSKMSDPLIFRFVLGQYEVQEPLIPAAHADMDGDGTVGFSDFGIWSQQYGKCHEGREEVPCQ